ncbi:Rv3654c family TadE-like protein [Streptomyces sp. NPDC005435]|uniref:Rv3654c family TadE-like protein n=1 Tax=Streptomyces sp. NPDC005435 TaxID=3154464 RepID=UPI003454CE2D
MRCRDGTARRGRGRGDQGSATVWSLGAIAVLCVVFGAVLALGHAVAVRHRAAGAADLAALAAADHWAEGDAAACARAERVATAQGARLVRCVLSGEVSDVSAGAGRGPFTAEVRSRAGPAESSADRGGGGPAAGSVDPAGPVPSPGEPGSAPPHSLTRSPPG